MKRSGTSIFLSLVVIITSMAQGARLTPGRGQQDRNLSQELPTVDQILDKYVQSLGGAAAFRKLTTRVSKGTLEAQNAEGAFTGNSEIYEVAPNKRVEINRIKLGACKEVEISEGFNGAVGWSSLNQFHKLEGAELAAKKLEAEFYKEIKLKELYPRMIVNGTVRIADRWTYVLDASSAEGSIEKMYFDIETGLLVRRDVAKYIEGVKVDFVIINKESRSVTYPVCLDTQRRGYVSFGERSV